MSLKLSRGEYSPEYPTPESIHNISLLPHELRSTEIYANSIVHYSNGCFINVIGIYTALAWRNMAFGLGTHAEWEGKLKINIYWNFRGKDG